MLSPASRTRTWSCPDAACKNRSRWKTRTVRLKSWSPDAPARPCHAARPTSCGDRSESVARVPRKNASELLKSRARHHAHQRERRGARGASVLARLRRQGGTRHRVFDWRRKADQRERQLARQWLRGHALHHPGARVVTARRRRSVRSAARQLRGGRQRKLRASSGSRSAASALKYTGGSFGSRALRCCSGAFPRARTRARSRAPRCTRPTATAKIATRNARPPWVNTRAGSAAKVRIACSPAPTPRTFTAPA